MKTEVKELRKEVERLRLKLCQEEDINRKRLDYLYSLQNQVHDLRVRSSMDRVICQRYEELSVFLTIILSNNDPKKKLWEKFLGMNGTPDERL